ncbi:MAG: energy-coupling factor ABC transporter permease [Clostridia bacterium]
MEKKIKALSFTPMLISVLCMPCYAMHIMEGFLPIGWSVAWSVIACPFFVFGFYAIKKNVAGSSRKLLLLAMCGAFAFVLSALKIPSVTGSSSHPTGVGIGAILFGPLAMTVVGTIVLLFQALLLAHGGITTLGANVFSMAIIGPLVSYFTYKISMKFNVNKNISIFIAVFLGDLLTYVTTSLQLGLAFADASGGIISATTEFLAIFAITQLPIAISEGILAVVFFSIIEKYSREEVEELLERKAVK